MINEIIHGDCLEVMKTFENNVIDLTVTSPPYDNLRDYKGYNFDFEGIAKELYRITKQGGVVVWVVGDATINGSETGTSFKQALYFKEIGFNLHDTMIFERQARFPDFTRYYPCFEYMFIFTKGKPETINLIKDKINTQRGNSLVSSTERNKDGSMRPMHGAIHKKSVKDFGVRGNIWKYNSGFMLSTTDTIAFNHPAIFPEQLAKDHIYSWSNEGDLVLDPFSGSGTTCKCAMQMNRNYIGIEIAKEYYDLSVKRINDYKYQINMFKDAI